MEKLVFLDVVMPDTPQIIMLLLLFIVRAFGVGKFPVDFHLYTNLCLGCFGVAHDFSRRACGTFRFVTAIDFRIDKCLTHNTLFDGMHVGSLSVLLLDHFCFTTAQFFLIYDRKIVTGLDDDEIKNIRFVDGISHSCIESAFIFCTIPVIVILYHVG